MRGITLEDLRALHPISDHIVSGSLADFTGDAGLPAMGAPVMLFLLPFRRFGRLLGAHGQPSREVIQDDSSE